MLTIYKTRRKMRRFLFYLLFLLAFLTLWCILTLIILFLQDAILGDSDDDRISPRVKSSDIFNGRGVQVVVGHYNGNLAVDKLKNLTDEELNANGYDPKSDWGVDGKAVYLSQDEQREADDIFPINQFNLYVSDRISINRTIPDVRKPSCRERSYPEISSLPNTSVIIVYHNEAYSTLLRTVWSVINQSPRSLIHEVIFVDDFSNRTFLRQPLDDAVKVMPVRVKIIRAKSRVGLIRARMMGAQEASGTVLTFLDSHCECTPGWLEPLLARIHEDRKNVVCPIIDVINDKTFQYQKGIELFRGGFNWNMQFRWYSMPTKMAHERLQNPTSPIESPTMAGGLFSIDRHYFEELGAYDPGMDIWGGENLEISFRIWQCGGRVEILPCSHVGHIFRKSSPHDFPGKGSGKVLNGNLIRAAEVWMDDWKHMFYKIAPQALHLRHDIDVSQRLELRKRLFCKDFRWYLDNIFTDHFYPMEGDFFGRIINIYSTNDTINDCVSWVLSETGIKKPHYTTCRDLESAREQINQQNWCLVSRPGEDGVIKQHKLRIQQCTLGFDLWQLWIYTKDGRIRSDEHLCLSGTQIVETNSQWMVQLKECAGYEMEYWDYSQNYRTFVHRESGYCLSRPKIHSSQESVNMPLLLKCRRSAHQEWLLKPIKWQP